jgi:hypothetical protein
MAFLGDTNAYPVVSTLTGFSFAGTQSGAVRNATIAQLDARYGGAAALLIANNLSDVAYAATARTNLGASSIGSTIFTAANAAAVITALSLGSLATASTINNSNWSGTDLAITNGGTGQSTATAAFDALSPLTTKGDLLAWDTSSNVRIAVGADGTVLTANAASTGGFTWSTPASTAAQYVVAASHSSLSAEKVLTAGSGITVTIAGTDAGTATVGIQAGGVTNAMLATMADQRIKGNVSGGSAVPSDLSATSVTAMLNAFVGDSGSGGTKGLVPAPAAADAAANKVLGAGGGWVAQSGAGGAPVDAQYLTLALNGTLTVERVLAFGAEFTPTDGGANANYDVVLATGGIANSKLANMAESTFKGRAASSGTGVPVDLTATQATAILNVFGPDSGAGGVKGLAPATVAGDADKYLRGNGTWDTPSGSSITLSSANAWTGVNSFSIADAATNTVTTALTLEHTTSNTAAASFGTALAFKAESAGGTSRTGMRLDAILATATDAAENFDFSVKLMAAGAAVAEMFKVTSAGVASAGGTILTKQSRTLAVSGGILIDAGTSTLDLSANRTIGYSASGYSLVTPDPAADSVGFYDNSGAVMARCLMMDVRPLESWIFAVGPENSGVAAGTTTLTFRAPYAFVVTEVQTNVRLHSISASITTNVLKGISSATATTITGGTSILNTQPILSTTTLTSVSGTPGVVNAAQAALTVDQWCGISVVYASGNATSSNAGMKVIIKGYRSA